MTLNFHDADRWSKCSYAGAPVRGAGSTVAIEKTKSKLEGEAAAWVIAGVLQGDAATTAEYEGEDAPNGCPVTAEMIRHCQAYIDIVRSYGIPITEQPRSIWNGLAAGRPDTVIDDPSRILRVLEFKYGRRIVEPEGNAQLLLGAISWFDPGRHDLVTLEVFQPRAFHPAGTRRRHSMNAEQLSEWNVWLHQRALDTLEPSPMATPGEHCLYCPRATGCGTLTANIYAAYETISDTRRSRTPTAAEIAAERTFLEMASKLIDIKLTSVRAETEARARAGEFLPGWSLEKRRTHRAFGVAMSVVECMTGIPAMKSVPKSPAEMEDEGANPDIINALCTPQHTGYELKPFKVSKVFTAKTK